MHSELINIRLNDSIATFLKTHLGWEQLTEIQKQAIPEEAWVHVGPLDAAVSKHQVDRKSVV